MINMIIIIVIIVSIIIITIVSLGKYHRLITLTEDCYSKKIKNLIRTIEEETPFSANGFFNIDRSILTAIAGAVLTYLIILIQFE